MDAQPSRSLLRSLSWQLPEVERVLSTEFSGTQAKRYAQREALEDSFLNALATMPAKSAWPAEKSPRSAEYIVPCDHHSVNKNFKEQELKTMNKVVKFIKEHKETIIVGAIGVGTTIMAAMIGTEYGDRRSVNFTMGFRDGQEIGAQDLAECGPLRHDEEPIIPDHPSKWYRAGFKAGYHDASIC